MPRRAGTTTIQITNITPDQKATIEQIQSLTGESINALLKRLLAEEAEKRNVAWQDDSLRGWTPRDND